MATNAPYYQMRGSGGGQFTNPTNASFASDAVVAGNYDLAKAATSAGTPPLTSSDAHAHAHAHAHVFAAATTQHQHQNLFAAQHIQDEAGDGDAPVVQSLEEENCHFVELLEAATEAAAGAVHMVDNTLALGDNDGDGDGGGEVSKGKRKRVSSSPPPEGAAAGGDAAAEPKRARVDCSMDPQLHSKEDNARDRSESGSVPPSRESLLNDARAAGLHSAAAIFRRSSENTSRKYARPPMSRLFISLQLTPENFVHLQGQAKAYMLDPAHPERQSCVGNKGKGDTDMVKLRLFNCVRDFLNEGIGDQYFGKNVEKPGESDTLEAARALGQERVSSEDKLVWPEDGNKIISLVTPLLRRMITNERQRIYAIGTRKGGSKKKDFTPMAEDTQVSLDIVHPRQRLEQLQTTFGSPRPHPLAPTQVQTQNLFESSRSHPFAQTQVHGQHLYTPSSSSPIPPITQPAVQDSIMTTHYAESKSAIELFPGEKLTLPTEQSSDPILSKINIFVTKNGHVLRSEKRFTNLSSAPLFHMTWQELNVRVLELVRETVSLYPQLQEELMRETGMEPETLRGLAVAAMQTNQTQGQSNKTTETSAEASDTAPTCSSCSTSTSPQSMKSPSFGPLSTDLPSFKVGAQASKGWVNIKSKEEWKDVKTDLARAMWADRVCCVVVELLP
ncbi:hypothetical protein P280DRAFT_489149 [Massarina eburnea CBS 473.64]|uniref:Uncharacterized protein n=1 Tax=Massarina eburnea CBS 473.64 TaxID=1395130 RepID=A0A6A6S1I7_9PLEO|nr:hypothetical protein P280DRAFT_489149 [Massarina eburnea CBS 473.64]